MEQRASFFLGSKTKKGFYSFFEQLQDQQEIQQVYLLKGGPGCGKSTLMRQLGEKLEALNRKILWIPCASDPESLDSVIDLDKRIAIVDATAPHTLEAKLPGAVETIVDVGQFWDTALLKARREEIVGLDSAIGHCHQRATALISGAAKLLDWNYQMACSYVNKSFLDEEAEKILALMKPESKAVSYKALLSAVSVGEIKFLDHTLRSLCDQVYTVVDEWGAGSDYLMHKVLEGSVSKGLQVIVCYCGIHGGEKIDHLIFPNQRIGLSQINGYHTLTHPQTTAVSSGMKPIEEAEREPMWELGDLAMEILDQATEEVLHAKEMHDDLEKIYREAMDFSRVDQLQSQLLEQWKSQ